MAQSETYIPPQAPDVESDILGAIMTDKEAADEGMPKLHETLFYNPANGIIFETLRELYDQNKPLDMVSVENHLKDRKQLDKIGGGNVIIDLTRSVSSASNILHHIEIIHKKYLRRKLVEGCRDIIDKAANPEEDINQTLDTATTFLDQLSLSEQDGNDPETLAQLLPKSLSEIEAAMNNPRKIVGVPTGLDIDQVTSGWKPGNLIILAARPSMGKTALMLTMARNSALYKDSESRYGGAIFSLEMTKAELVERFLSQESEINSQFISGGRLEEEEFKTISTDVAQKLYNAGIIIDDTAGVTLRHVRSRARSLKRRHDIGWIMIDYLQLMQGMGKNENRNTEIEQITRGLKSLAKELQVPVIALSQLSRNVEYRTDKRPQLSDLRDSGSIEQDADVVVFLYRPEYYGITQTPGGYNTKGLAETIVAKQRNGPIGAPKATFIKEYGVFKKWHNPGPTNSDNSNYKSPLPDDNFEDEEPF